MRDVAAGIDAMALPAVITTPSGPRTYTTPRDLTAQMLAAVQRRWPGCRGDDDLTRDSSG